MNTPTKRIESGSAACFRALKRMPKRPCPLHSIAGAVPFRDCSSYEWASENSGGVGGFRYAARRSRRIIIVGQVRFPPANLFTKIQRETSHVHARSLDASCAKRDTRQRENPRANVKTHCWPLAVRVVLQHITVVIYSPRLLLRGGLRSITVTPRESFHGLSGVCDKNLSRYSLQKISRF